MVYLNWDPCVQQLSTQKNQLELIIDVYGHTDDLESVMVGWINITLSVLERCFSADDRRILQFMNIAKTQYSSAFDISLAYLRLMESYIHEFDRGLIEPVTPPTTQPHTIERSSSDVFIVHGHAEAIVDEVAIFIDNLGFNPRIFKREPDRGNTIIEKLERISSEVSFAVVILTGDDLGGERSISSYEQLQKISRRLRGILIELGVAKVLKSNTSSVQGILNQAASIIEKLEPRARQNVIFELGFFFGLLGRDNVCVLYENGIVPSTPAGIMAHHSWLAVRR